MQFIQTYGDLVAEVMALLLIGSILIGMCLARRIGVTHITIPTKRLKKKKVRLVLISDIHIGPILGPGFLAKVARIVRAQHPDVLLAAGDLVDTKADLLARWSKDFKALFSVAPTYAVTGNHELINGLEETVELLEKCGARFLRDSSVVDERTGITIIGLEEPPNQMQRRSEFGNLEKMLSEADPDRPVVVINHQPRGFEVVAKHGAELMLSGHTHGGQMWPFSYFVWMTYHRYTKGLNAIGDSRIYTLNGTGTWGPPMRLGANPEVLVVDFVKRK